MCLSFVDFNQNQILKTPVKIQNIKFQDNPLLGVALFHAHRHNNDVNDTKYRFQQKL